MKTAKDKAIELLEKVRVSESEFNRLLRAITIALKEQDRDTRHACAEAVVCLHSRQFSGEINKDEAHAACMNVKAV